jgi:hypothetical protein
MTSGSSTPFRASYADPCLRRNLCIIQVARIVFPLRVCTGAVVSETLCDKPKQVPQLDMIIWSPAPAPALFEAGDFGLVPRGSCFGILEIKRSAYKHVGRDLKARLCEELVRKLVADPPPGQRPSADPDLYPDFPAMGVICIKGKTRDRELEELLQRGHAVVLFELVKDDLEPNPEAVHRLLNFLIRTRQKARAWDGEALINMALFSTR